MAFPKKLLTGGEEVVFDLHPHWKALVSPVFWTVVIGAAAGFAYVKAPLHGEAQRWLRLGLVVVAAVVCCATAGLALLRWRFTEFVLTNERLIARTGVIAKRTKDIPLERITDITVTQSVLDRILGAGSVTLESAGEYGQEVFNEVAHPTEVQKRVYEMAETRKGSRGAPRSVADELSGLADLRARGILTPEEFEARKRKLLAD